VKEGGDLLLVVVSNKIINKNSKKRRTPGCMEVKGNNIGVSHWCGVAAGGSTLLTNAGSIFLLSK
jgi:hypothetical protein